MTDQQGFDERATMLDKPAPAVEETIEDIAERWVRAFDTALRARSETGAVRMSRR